MTIQTLPHTARSPRPNAPSSHDRRDWRYMETMIALTFGVPVQAMRAPTRREADVAFARQVVMYMARAAAGMRYTAIGRLCGRDHTTVAHACRIVEDRRDDPAIDRVLRALEDLFSDIAAQPPGRPRGRV